MSNSSQPTIYSTILNDPTDTITITNPASYSIGSGDVILTSSYSASMVSSSVTMPAGDFTISLENNPDYTTSWAIPKEWVDSFPDWNKVQDMIEKYPGLKIALQNFETIYKLVKDDYDTTEDQK
jgi:hypothetical protein